ANRHFVVVCSQNTRTHSGHIPGTADAPRRLMTSSDTTSVRDMVASVDDVPAKWQGLLSRQARARTSLHRGTAQRDRLYDSRESAGQTEDAGNEVVAPKGLRARLAATCPWLRPRLS